MEVSGWLHLSIANPTTESCVPIGLETELRPGPFWILWSKERFAGYGKINCMYGFLICSFKSVPML